MTAAITGLVTGFSLIVAIGAQNAYVLRQGLSRNRVGTIVTICVLADGVLILAGVTGLGAAASDHPTVLRVLTYAGAAYLCGFALRSWWSALRPGPGLHPEPSGMGTVVRTTLALTLLNPHVYLDTVLLIGMIGAQQGDPGRWQFAAGAITASTIWFTGLGFGAFSLSNVLAGPVVWRVIDVLVGFVMLAVAISLVRG